MTPERALAFDASASNTDHSKVFDKIRFQVLQSLGEPEHLRGVNVRPLWGQHFRVNVYVGREPSSATVAHSYFLLADADGRIISSNPIITRTYGLGTLQINRPATTGQNP
jgi:hypothetical protein